MKQYKTLIIVTAFLVVTGASALWISPGSAAPANAAAQEPGPDVSVVTPQALLPLVMKENCPNIFDDFSDPSSGWPIAQLQHVDLGYMDGEYRIASKSDKYLYSVAAPTCPRDSYVVQATIRWEGARGAGIGLAFDIQDSFEEYYLFFIDVNSREIYLLYRYPGGWLEVRNIWCFGMQFGDVFRLRVDRNGINIRAKVTNQDGDYCTLLAVDVPKGGRVGLFAVPYLGQNHSDARFDDFSMIYRPSSGYSQPPRQVAGDLLSAPRPLKEYSALLQPAAGDLFLAPRPDNPP